MKLEEVLRIVDGFCDEGQEELSNYITNQNKLIKLLDEYLEFLNKENEGPITVAYLHGWRCSDKALETGKGYRVRIDGLKKEIYKS